jgi:hypothetical protein
VTDEEKLLYRYGAAMVSIFTFLVACSATIRPMGRTGGGGVARERLAGLV